MTDKRAEFRALAAKVVPLQTEADGYKLRLTQLSHEISLDIIRQAFPNAMLVQIRAVAEVKPSDLAKSADETVALLIERGIQPTIIISDAARCTVTIGMELPPAATPQKKIAKRRK